MISAFASPGRLAGKAGRLLTFAALMGLFGGHWAILQTIAWAGMLNSYVRTAPVMQAIAKTFSGRDPCAMCRKVEQGRQQERAVAPILKIDKKAEDFFSPRHEGLKMPPFRDFDYVASAPSGWTARPGRPPLPVPRGIAS